jgi:hypothetical protein
MLLILLIEIALNGCDHKSLSTTEANSRLPIEQKNK